MGLRTSSLSGFALRAADGKAVCCAKDVFRAVSGKKRGFTGVPTAARYGHAFSDSMPSTRASFWFRTLSKPRSKGPKPHRGFDNPEHRFDGLFAQGVDRTSGWLLSRLVMRSTGVASAPRRAARRSAADQRGWRASRATGDRRLDPDRLGTLVSFASLKKPVSARIRAAPDRRAAPALQHALDLAHCRSGLDDLRDKRQHGLGIDQRLGVVALLPATAVMATLGR